MGYMCHHAIIVTSWNTESIEAAHGEAIRLFGDFDDGGLGATTNLVSPIILAAVNDYHSFFIAPDGSKEGWDTSDLGDKLRAEFVRWLGQQTYADGSSSLDWALVQFGDEDGDQRVLLASRLTPPDLEDR